MTNKEKYIHFCSQQPLIPIYMRDWWLDSECGPDKWDVLLYEKENNIQAFMLYYLPYKGTITMPAYGKAMGIWFDPLFEDEKYSKELHRKHTICQYFIDHLPEYTTYLQNFHFSFTDWLPFYWNGFKQTTRYNYIIPDISDTEMVWDKMQNKIKKNINVARDKYKLQTRKGITIDEFLFVINKTFENQRMNIPASDSLRKLIEESRKRDQGDLWGAYDEEGNIHAAIFVVWQESSAYAIAGGRNTDMPNSNAHVLLKWEAICFASTVSKSYDFCGSMLKGVEFLNREFGAVQYPYFCIYKGKKNFLSYYRAGIKKLKKLRR